MSNLLELENNNTLAESLAAPYKNIEVRKEIYLKYIIADSLKKAFPQVNISDSLFYSNRFYTKTRLFDLYINNNVFDILILKPDSNELLFDTIQDDMHANIYGYIVVRLAENLKSSEVLGYLLSKDFLNAVNGNKLELSTLKKISTLDTVEEVEAQMAMSDVEERFFELVSIFLDENIDEQSLSELACLLYNSSELRNAFSEIGRFEKLCFDLKDNKDLVSDEFLSIFGDSEEEEYELEDLSLLEQEEAETVAPEDIEPGTLFDEEQPEEELIQDTDDEDDILDNDEENTGDEDEYTEDADNQDELENDTPVDELELNEETDEDDFFAITEDAVSEDETSVSENNNDDFGYNVEELNLSDDDEDDDNLLDLNELDSMVQQEATETLIQEEKSTITEEEYSFEFNLDELSNEPEPNIVETTHKEEIIPNELTPNILETDEELKEFSENDLDDLETSDEDFSLDIPELQDTTEEKEEQQQTPPKSNLAAELAALSAKRNQAQEENIPNTQEPTQPEQTLQPEIEPVASPKIEEQKQHPQITDELMEILRDADEDIQVNDDELRNILGTTDEKTTPHEIENNEIFDVDSLAQAAELFEQEATQNNVQQLPNQPHEIQLEEDNTLVAQTQQTVQQQPVDLDVFYKEENQATKDVFPGGGIVNKENKKQPAKQLNKKVAVILAACAVLAIAGVSVTLSGNKSSDNSMEMAENFPTNDITQPENDFSNNTMPDTDGIGMPIENQSQGDDTKIVSSLSKQAGAAPVILKSVAWQVPASISNDVVFSKYLQIAGKNIKLNLASDLLETDDFAYNNKIKVSMTVKNNTPVKDIKITESSGSKEVDSIVLQSIKQTLKYINTPVMSSDSGDRVVILVISI